MVNVSEEKVPCLLNIFYITHIYDTANAGVTIIITIRALRVSKNVGQLMVNSVPIAIY